MGPAPHMRPALPTTSTTTCHAHPHITRMRMHHAPSVPSISTRSRYIVAGQVTQPVYARVQGPITMCITNRDASTPSFSCRCRFESILPTPNPTSNPATPSSPLHTCLCTHGHGSWHRGNGCTRWNDCLSLGDAHSGVPHLRRDWTLHGKGWTFCPQDGGQWNGDLGKRRT